MNDENPLVSVLLIVNNHTLCLRQLLNSILVQKTNFKYEIVVVDDTSHNAMRNILIEYKNLYADKFNLILKDESSEPSKNLYESLVECQGNYIAVVEGDDYWSDEQKLQIQFEFMETHPKCSESFHAVTVIDSEGTTLDYRVCPYRKTSVMNVIELNKGYHIPATSIMLRNVFKKYNYRRYFEKAKFVGDSITHTIALRHGSIQYIDRNMCVYRYSLNADKSLSKKLDVAKLEENILMYMVQKELVTKEYKPFIQSEIEKQMEYLQNIASLYKNTKNKKPHECIICGSPVSKFLPYKSNLTEDLFFVNKYNCVGSDIVNFACPHCYCTDRERHLFLYFHELKLWDEITSSTRVLHLAPEEKIYLELIKRTPLYVCGDLCPQNFRIRNMQELDATKLPFEDNSFDFIVANHILEHIPNDISAMKEFFRVLAPNGKAILQTPYSKNLETTFEDSSICTPEGRFANFGQDDHVRVYAKNDFFNRLSSAGFTRNIITSRSLFTDKEATYYGINNEEDLILCAKL